MNNLADYNYILPKDRIAQKPAEKRDHSRLLVLENKNIKHRQFYQIIDEIEEGDVFVVNNSKVIASTLKGKKETGGKVEILFLREINSQENEWECLLKGRKLRVGGKLNFLDSQLIGTIMKWKKLGQFIVKFTADTPIQALLNEYASITLPPYIKTPQDDISRYQTVYASKDGSIAAPTAGFHFTRDIIQKMHNNGAKFVEITLHVGYSTFMRLDNEILSNGQMDSEYFTIPTESAAVIEDCLNRNDRLIVVGTTTMKALESATNQNGKIKKLRGWSNLFIAPGYSFNLKISRMVTNFHLPKSSPLLMVCAFAGKERILNAYKEAVSNNYRFYSFGDAMFCDSG